MKILQVKLRNSIAMPDTNTGNTESIKANAEVSIELLSKLRSLSITKRGFPVATIVPLEQVAWMKAEPEEAASAPEPPKTPSSATRS